MGHVQQFFHRTTRWIGRGLPWVFVFGLSAGVAGAIDSAATRALPAPSASEGARADDIRNPCALDVDGALYGGYEWWLPAGRSAICRPDAYPGLPGPGPRAAHARHPGTLPATLPFASPPHTHIPLN